MTKLPDFLTRSRSKILRTVLYGDCEYSPFEIEVVHTPLFQRLYGLKQLGFSDRVFPDAVHSRFNHVLGVVQQAEAMAKAVTDWLEQNPAENFAFRNPHGDKDIQMSADDLLRHIGKWRPAMRLIALTHDLTHAAFGHTLEDEICVFEQRHDDPARQAKFFDALVAQLVWIWSIELGFPSDLDELQHINALNETDCLHVDEAQVIARAKWMKQELSHFTSKSEVTKTTPLEELQQCCLQLEWAFTALLYLESLHEDGTPSSRPPLLITRVLAAIQPGHSGPDFALHRDAFALDMIGNTICADLLDYAQRDSHFSGLKTAFDNRVIRYLAIVSVHNKPGCHLCPTDDTYLRLAIQYHTDKVRLDVISEMTQVLRTRYHITESVLLHPTKCAAGAMLGRVVQMLGINRFPDRLLVMTDNEIMRVLDETAHGLESLCQALPEILAKEPDLDLDGILLRFAQYDEARRELIGLCIQGLVAENGSMLIGIQSAEVEAEIIRERATAARRILWNLRARRFPQPVFRIRCGIQLSDNSNGQKLAEKFTSKEARAEIERELEMCCDLPMGSVFIHCPRARTGMKLAQALLFGPDKNNVRYLRDLAGLGNKQELKPYQNEVKAIEEMYNSIWKFHIFLDRAHLDKELLVAKQAVRLLKFPNDDSLQSKLEESTSTDNPYALLCDSVYEDEFPYKHLPLIVEDIGQKLKHMARERREHEGVKKANARQLVMEAIASANQRVTPRDEHTVDVSALEPKKTSEAQDEANSVLELNFNDN